MNPRNINLYDSSLRKPREWLTPASAVGALVACGVMVVMATAGVRYQLNQLRAPAAQNSLALHATLAELTELTQRVSELKPDPSLQAELQIAQTTLIQRQAALNLLRSGGLGAETGHAAALSAFARQSINGLWLTGLTLDNQQVALRGRALSPELIPSYVNRLNQEKALQGRSFRALDISRPMQAEAAASNPPHRAGFVEFSLVSAQGAEAPSRALLSSAKEVAP